MIVYIFITQFSMRLNLPYLSDDGQASPPSRSISITKERERPISRNRPRSNFHKIYGKDLLKKLWMSNNKKGCKCINVRLKYDSSSPSCFCRLVGSRQCTFAFMTLVHKYKSQRKNKFRWFTLKIIPADVEWGKYSWKLNLQIEIF